MADASPHRPAPPRLVVDRSRSPAPHSRSVPCSSGTATAGAQRFPGSGLRGRCGLAAGSRVAAGPGNRIAVGWACLETGALSALTPGKQLGPYRVVGVLGPGGAGEVYRASDERLGREVAIKVLSEGLANDSQARARFEREARTVAAGITRTFARGTVSAGLLGDGIGPRPDVGRAYRQGTDSFGRITGNRSPDRRSTGGGPRKAVVDGDLKPGNLKVTSGDTVRQ
jgi:hypothetical protein